MGRKKKHKPVQAERRSVLWTGARGWAMFNVLVEAEFKASIGKPMPKSEQEKKIEELTKQYPRGIFKIEI